MNDSYLDYGAVDLHTRAATASPHELVLMLFDGLLDEMARLRGHLQAENFAFKRDSIDRCLNILDGLDGALDFENGGPVVKDLSRLYGYCGQQLCNLSVTLSQDLLDELVHLLNELRDGWRQVGSPR